MTDRFRRYRERQKRGIAVVQVEVCTEDLWALIDAGVLDVDDSEDRAAVADAIRKSLRVAFPSTKIG